MKIIASQKNKGFTPLLESATVQRFYKKDMLKSSYLVNRSNVSISSFRHKKAVALFSTGFTLVEVLVSIGIMVIIGLAIANFQRDLFSINTGVQNNLSAQLEGRKILRIVIAELREASPSSLGAYTVAQAGTSTLTFYSNIDTDSYKEKIRYFLQGNELRRGVTKPSGNPLVYNSANENINIVVRNIINGTSTPIFDFFDGNFTGTSTPLVEPINVLSVRLVRVTVIIDKDINRPPGAIKVSSQGMLRNLKDNQ